MKDAHLIKGSILSYLDLCSNQFCFVLSPYTQQVLNATRMKRHPLLLSSWCAPDHTYRRTEVLNSILGFYISFLGNLFLIYYLRPKFLFTFTQQPNSLNKRNPCFSAALSRGVEGLGFPPCCCQDIWLCSQQFMSLPTGYPHPSTELSGPSTWKSAACKIILIQ